MISVKLYCIFNLQVNLQTNLLLLWDIYKFNHWKAKERFFAPLCSDPSIFLIWTCSIMSEKIQLWFYVLVCLVKDRFACSSRFHDTSDLKLWCSVIYVHLLCLFMQFILIGSLLSLKLFRAVFNLVYGVVSTHLEIDERKATHHEYTRDNE